MPDRCRFSGTGKLTYHATEHPPPKTRYIQIMPIVFARLAIYPPLMSENEKTQTLQPVTPQASDSLDPADWDKFLEHVIEELKHVTRHLATVRDRPAWQPIPGDVKRAIAEDLPLEAQGAERVCDDIRSHILPYLLGNTHPRFFGWVHGTGTAGGLLADLYGAAINANLGGREHAPVYVERAVIDWCKEIFGFPETSSGLLISGTSMANAVALAVARNHHCPVGAREEGLTGLSKTMVGYTSTETHSSVAKAFEFLGLGSNQLHKIPVNSNFQIDLHELRIRVAADREAGLQPFCVIGNAGTVNSAAIDDLDGLASFCDREKLWLHVDGAFGAMAILSDEFRGDLAGIERADSLAFDFHKWIHVCYDAGCVLVRNAEAHQSAFNTSEDYLETGRGAAAGAPWFCEFGPELSRGFRALNVWFTIKEHGLNRLGAKISDNCHLARYLGDLVEKHPNLERLAPVSLNIVCFRYRLPELAGAELDSLNEELVLLLQESGVAVPSKTRVNNQAAIRVNVTNHRTTRADMRVLVAAIDEIAPEALSRVIQRSAHSQDRLPGKPPK